jgi:hypothetical protein
VLLTAPVSVAGNCHGQTSVMFAYGIVVLGEVGLTAANLYSVLSIVFITSLSRWHCGDDRYAVGLTNKNGREEAFGQWDTSGVVVKANVHAGAFRIGVVADRE